MIYSLIDRASNMLNNQANILIQGILADIQTNSISSIADLSLATSAAFTSFYANYGSPLSPVLLFTGIPIVDSYNDFQTMIVGDLTVLYDQILDIQQETNSNLVFEKLQNELLISGIASLQAQITAAAPTRTTLSGLQSWTLTDTLTDSSNIDTNSSQNIGIFPGVIELGYSSNKNYNQQANIIIDDLYINMGTSGNSNGFAGNIHEVISTQNTNPLTVLVTQSEIKAAVNSGTASIVFAGDGDLRADITAVLNTNSKTWFEYEVCNVPGALKISPSQYYGFSLGIQLPGDNTVKQLPWTEFHEASTVTVPSNLPIFPPLASTSQTLPTETGSNNSGNYVNAAGVVSDPSTGVSASSAAVANQVTLTETTALKQGDTLYLSLIITFPTPQNLSQITITPQILGNLVATVESVKIQGVDANTTINAYNIPSSSSNPQVFIFPQSTVSRITILMSQAQSYAASIGHLVWIDTDASPSAEIYNASFGNVALTTVPTGDYTRVDGPNPIYSRVLNIATTVSDTLDTSTVSSSVSGPYVEIFPGWRYAIGLKTISLDSVTYTNSGVLVTKNFSVPVNISTASIQVDQILPVSSSSSNTGSITYELSFDGGSTWYPISPSNGINRTSAPTTYILNSSAIGISGTPITTTPNPQSVRMRATFTSGQDPTQTPRLCSYKILLQGAT